MFTSLWPSTTIEILPEYVKPSKVMGGRIRENIGSAFLSAIAIVSYREFIIPWIKYCN